MTQEEKAKAYDNVRNKIATRFGTNVAQEIFSEYEKSEDELTWLTKYIEEEAYSLSMDIRDDEDRIKLKKLQKAYAWLEKQGEGKSINDTDENIVEAVKETSILDMVESKFKVGDWIASNYRKWITQITSIHKDGYTNSNNGFILFKDEKHYHLWTIQDAEDGDVLACGDKVTDCPFIFHNLTEELNPRSYCGVNTLRHFQVNDENGGFWCDSYEVRPATKEQRDLLFQKMKDAGYEWDEAKKELNHRWENGDIVRLKEDDGTRWQIGKSNDPDFFDEWFICEICESGIAGGYVSTHILDTDYEFITNPINDAQKEIDKEFDKLRETASETTWSKNDEYLRCWTYDNLRELKDRYGEDYGNVGKCIEWIKSIKERLGGKELKGE